MEVERTKVTKVSANSNSLPSDLMMEIIKKLPVKTIIRFLTVSKLWSSIIRSPYFIKLYLDQSLTRPKSLIFMFKRENQWTRPFFEVDLKNTREGSTPSSPSLDIYHVTCHIGPRTTITPSVHGLICYGPASSMAIYNPCTRRSISLPFLDVGRRAISRYIGYDPIGNDYKVLCITRGTSKLRNRRGLAEKIWVLTLGSLSWRMYQNIVPPHSPEREEFCMKGVLYYRAFIGEKLNDTTIMSFDVRSEKFDVIKGPCTFRGFSKLTSYEGKLAVIFIERKANVGLWILEDGSKEKWLNKSFALPDLGSLKITNPLFYRINRPPTMDIDTGEIILTPSYVSALLPCAIYCDLKKNTMRDFQVEGATNEYANCRFEFVSCQAENLMFL